MSKIEWTDITCNPITVKSGGHWCHKISEGCANCYAEAINTGNRFNFASGLAYKGEPPELELNYAMLESWSRMRKSKFVSFEPLLEPVLIGNYAQSIDLAIVGAESGRRARPMDEDWVRSLRDQIKAANKAFFYKQKVVNGHKVSLPELDGKVWSELPL